MLRKQIKKRGRAGRKRRGREGGAQGGIWVHISMASLIPPAEFLWKGLCGAGESGCRYSRESFLAEKLTEMLTSLHTDQLNT